MHARRPRARTGSVSCEGSAFRECVSVCARIVTIDFILFTQVGVYPWLDPISHHLDRDSNIY